MHELIRKEIMTDNIGITYDQDFQLESLLSMT
jgi:hypothetical protein